MWLVALFNIYTKTKEWFFLEQIVCQFLDNIPKDFLKTEAIIPVKHWKHNTFTCVLRYQELHMVLTWTFD